MGVERAVTRWYLQRQAIINEIMQLERLVSEVQKSQGLLTQDSTESKPADPDIPGTTVMTEATALRQNSDGEVTEVTQVTEITHLVQESETNVTIVEQSSFSEMMNLRMTLRRVHLSIKRIAAASASRPSPQLPELRERLRAVRARLLQLGPCPKPMMG